MSRQWVVRETVRRAAFIAVLGALMVAWGWTMAVAGPASAQSAPSVPASFEWAVVEPPLDEFDDGRHRHAVAVAADGSILVSERRDDGKRKRLDDYASSDLYVHRSSDGGQTWTRARVASSKDIEAGAFMDEGDALYMHGYTRDRARGTFSYCTGAKKNRQPGWRKSRCVWSRQLPIQTRVWEVGSDGSPVPVATANDLAIYSVAPRDGSGKLLATGARIDRYYVHDSSWGYVKEPKRSSVAVSINHIADLGSVKVKRLGDEEASRDGALRTSIGLLRTGPDSDPPVLEWSADGRTWDEVGELSGGPMAILDRGNGVTVLEGNGHTLTSHDGHEWAEGFEPDIADLRATRLTAVPSASAEMVALVATDPWGDRLVVGTPAR